MWDEIQTEAHGPDYSAQAFIARAKAEKMDEDGESEVPRAELEDMGDENDDFEGPEARDREDINPIIPYQRFEMDTPSDVATEGVGRVRPTSSQNGSVSYTHLTLPTKRIV